MTAFLSAFFLIAGAALCLLAAIGVLRLPDFFMRMHAATKAGVAGCGLLLIGVAFAYPSPGMWIKVAIAIAFLLLTTPIAGHLLARAGYVAGVPLWGGTREDQLEGELRRGQFDRPAATVRRGPVRNAVRHEDTPGISSIVLALASGRHALEAINQATMLAKAHQVPLVGLAIIDTKMLSNVWPVPIGGNYYAAQLRRGEIEKARRSLADAVQRFEQTARNAGVPFSLLMEEGDPVKIMAARQRGQNLMLIGRDGWFDHGVSGGRSDPLTHLVRRGVYPLVSVAQSPRDVRSVTFIHDGSAHSDDTLRWFLEADPWPDAELRLLPDTATGPQDITKARALAAARMGGAEKAGDAPAVDPVRSEVVIFGNEGHEGWINRARAASRPSYDDVPIVVFG